MTELEMTKLRVDFSNNPTLESGPDKTLRESINVWLSNRDGNTMPLLPAINPDSSVEFLYHNPSLNKIHSISLDYIESLPFRPDLAFDSAWRAFEVTLHLYHKIKTNKSNAVKAVDIIPLFSKNVVIHLTDKYPELKLALNEIIQLTPDSIGRFVLARMLSERGIFVLSQYRFIKDRVIEILGLDLYRHYQDRYLKNGTINAADHRNGAMKILRMLKGEPMTFNGKPVKDISDYQKISFILSAILYASRCERAHGDYFSPFFSDRATFKTYTHWYWILVITLTLHSLLLFKLSQDLGNPLYPIKGVIEAINYNLQFCRLE